jgi:hypothetical protein
MTEIVLVEQFEYDVALSFAGEDREYVEALAGTLRNRSVKVFYDRFEASTMWGRNLYDHLSEVYGGKARHTIMFVSEAYARKNWTSHERQTAQAHALREHHEYVLPVRFDDTVIPGLEAVAYVDLRHTSQAELVDLILAKLGHTSPDRAVPTHDGLINKSRESTVPDLTNIGESSLAERASLADPNATTGTKRWLNEAKGIGFILAPEDEDKWD